MWRTLLNWNVATYHMMLNVMAMRITNTAPSPPPIIPTVVPVEIPPAAGETCTWTQLGIWTLQGNCEELVACRELVMVCRELVTSSVENPEIEVVICVGFAPDGRIDIGDSVAPAPICLWVIQNQRQHKTAHF